MFGWKALQKRLASLQVQVGVSEERMKTIFRAELFDVEERVANLEAILRDEGRYTVDGVLKQAATIFEAAVKLRAVDAYAGVGSGPQLGTITKDEEEDMLARLKNAGVEVMEDEVARDDAAVEAFMGRDV